MFPRRQLLRLPEHAGAGLGGHTFTKVSLGENHACGVATNGTLYCWGGNDLGQLGDGTTADRSVPTPVAAASSPAG